VKIRRRYWILGGAGILALAAAGFGGHYYYTRYVLANFKTVVPGRIYRSGQPSPKHLRQWKEEHGIRTVINLRGASDREEYAAERQACAELGLELVDLEWSAVRMPGPEAVRKLVDVLEKSRQPVLLHCARGIDRSGVASVLAAMMIGGQDYATARKQIGSKYDRIGSESDGCLGLLFRYEADCTARGRDTGGWPQFREWLDQTYRD
jgi:protein tyrosine/serine phosphatase